MDKISELLGTATGVPKKYEMVKESNDVAIKALETCNTLITSPKKNDDFKEDVEYAKNNLKDIIETGMSSLSDVFDVMGESQDAKVFTAAAAYLKTLAELNKMVVDISEKSVKLSTPETQQPNVENQQNNITNNIVNNNITNVTTEQMLKELEDE